MRPSPVLTRTGELDIYAALSSSCNGVFALLAAELGDAVLEAYTRQAGLTARYSVSGLNTAAGSFAFSGLSQGALGWAGVGQGDDLVNPCALMVYMGAIANGEARRAPQLVLKTENALGLPSGFYRRKSTGTLVAPATAATWPR